MSLNKVSTLTGSDQDVSNEKQAEAKKLTNNKGNANKVFIIDN
jgi:hypothetical protein